MIETLKLKNFKVLRDVEAELRPLTVIVGPNSSGKSTMLEALSLSIEYLRRDVPALANLRIFGSRIAHAVSVLSGSGRHAGKEFTFAVSFTNHGVIESVRSWGGVSLASRESGPVIDEVFLDLDTKKLAAPSYPTGTSLDLPPDGAGLSSLLSGLAIEDPQRFHVLVEQLRAVVPSVEGISFQRVPVEDRVGYQLFFNMKGAPGVPADSVSEGTLLTLGLLTTLALPDPPSLVLIDDIERGLHPVAQASLIHSLRAVQRERPDLQIVATSHSPYLLDCFEADEILLTSLDDTGYASVKPLTAHPDYERSKTFLDPGEFWSSVGEGWITKASR